MKIFAIGFMLMMSALNIAFAQNFSFLTYNIRYANPGDGPNRWDLRKQNLAEQIKFHEPDVFGIQEGLNHQLEYLDSALADYVYFGVGRDDGKKKGEYTAIFYKKDKFKVIEKSTFWLSKTPDEVSVGWDAALPRICTYALFESRDEGTKFWVFNTHFDHVGKKARVNSAKLIVEKIKTYNKKDLPAILMGDLNLEPKSDAIQFLSKNLNDAKLASKKVVFGPEGTFNAFQFNRLVTRRIDYIFTDKDHTTVLKYAVLSDSKDLKYYSDHLPVYVEVKID